jgi:hypothetical protein
MIVLQKQTYLRLAVQLGAVAERVVLVVDRHALEARFDSAGSHG